MMQPPSPQPFDRELAALSLELRWREWMRRIEAVLFASAAPVGRQELARVVGEQASVDLLIADLAADMVGRPYEVMPVAGAWVMRTRPAYSSMIRAASEVSYTDLSLREADLAVLAAIAYHQPITREGLKDIFGKDINRDLIGRLSDLGLITTGPRVPRRGAPYSFVTTPGFLLAFGFESLRDLPDVEQADDAGLTHT